MLQRHHGHDFMANAWVFPGGRLDEQDHVVDVADLTARQAGRRLDDDTDPQTALALHVAALRETFEEAGLLLAHRSDDGSMITFDDSSTRSRFQAFRSAVDEGELDLAELCRREALVLRVSNLRYLAHWITPDFESRRYDTRFFVASAPPDQQATHDNGETTHGDWMSPHRAIERYRDDEILLAPPTLRILEELTTFSSTRHLFAELQTRDRPPAILPHPIQQDSADLVLVFPGDPDYPSDHPEMAMTSPVKSGVTRMIRRGDQWFSIQ